MALILSGDTGVPASGMPTGSVIQTVSTTKTDSFSTNSTSFTDVTGLYVTITPSSATSKILITASVSYSSNPDDVLIRLVRDSTAIAVGTSGASYNGLNQINGNAPNRYGMNTGSTCYLDSPATASAITYKIQMMSVNGGAAYGYVNRRGESTNYGGTSTITVMEIKV